MDDGSHTGYQLPQELTLLRDQVRRFMREEVKPVEDKLPLDAIECAPEHLARVVVAEESAKCRAGAYSPALGAFGGGPPTIVWSGAPNSERRLRHRVRPHNTHGGSYFR